MKAKIEVTLREDIFDPQGKAILNALHHLDYSGVSNVKAGKLFYVELNEKNPDLAMKMLHEMADELFANTVVENYTVSLVD